MKLQPGGSQGGEVKFLIGLLMTAAGLWFFFDSVRFTTGHPGMISGAMHGGRGGGAGHGGGMGMGQTTSMGIVLVPLFVGVVALFFDVRRTWAWIITWVGVAVLAIEIVSRFRPEFQVNGTHAIMMLVLIAGGIGFMLRAYVEDRRSGGGKNDQSGGSATGG